MRAVRALAAVELRRFLRDRSNVFFVLILPLLLVVVIGAQFGGSGSEGQVTVVGDANALRSAVAGQLESHDLEVSFQDREAALELVARGRADVALVLDGPSAAAFEAREAVPVRMTSSTRPDAFAVTQRVTLALGQLSTELLQLAALEANGVDPADAEAALSEARAAVVAPELRIVDVDDVTQQFAGLGQFDLGAVYQLLVFVFLSSLTGAATLIQSRRLRVTSRILSTPVSTVQALGGQVVGRFAIAVFQGGYIMVATAVLFDVDWGNPVASLALLAMFSLVAAGAAMVVGAVMDNEGAASGLGVGLGLVLAALGGCMMPLEFFPDSLRTVANVTPHAWANQAFAEIQRHDGTLVDVLPQLGVLAAMAVLLLGVGTWALRRSLSRAI